MTDEIALRKDMGRAAQAQALLDNELLNEAFDQLKDEYISYWAGHTSIDDIAGRERIWQAVQIVGKVRSHLHSIVNHGELARHELSDMAQGRQS